MSKTTLGILIILGLGVLVAVGLMVIPALNYFEKAPEVEESQNPAEVVDAFYTDYLNYIGQPGSDSFRNPLQDGYYQSSDYLTKSFVEHVDEILAGGFPADPFLCAQDIPASLESEGVLANGESASVVVRSSIDGHVFTVQLLRVDEGWKISSVSCSSSPPGKTTAFYTWYLSQFGDRSQGLESNPLQDETYLSSGMLSEAFENRIRNQVESGEGLRVDPFLLAQDLPAGFSVDPDLIHEHSAVAHFVYGSNSVQHLRVSFVEEDGQLRIDSIEKAN